MAKRPVSGKKKQTTMNVALPQSLRVEIERAVDQGRFDSSSSLIREGVRRVLEEERKLAALRKMLREAEAQIERGEYFEFTPRELMKHVDAKLKAARTSTRKSA
ncbi:hypothetical protein BH11PLA1_BH11PLA1_13650 [soil metagenome]